MPVTRQIVYACQQPAILLKERDVMNKSIYTASDLSAEFMQLCKDGKKRDGFSTGFFSLDEFLKLAPGYISIVSGIPSMGKSEFVDAVTLNMALQHGWKWCFFSPENYPVVEHMAKIAEKFVGKRLDYFTANERKTAVEWMNEYFFWLYPEDENQLAFARLIELIQQVHTSHNLSGFVLDPWNEITHDNRNLRDDQYLAVALRNLRRFARQQNLHGIVIAHPNKTEKVNGQYVPPTLYDLNGGAMWYNKADYGWVIHRPDWNSHSVKVYVQKVKFKWMGRKGEAELLYDPMSGRFRCADNPDFTLPHNPSEPPL